MWLSSRCVSFSESHMDNSSDAARSSAPDRAASSAPRRHAVETRLAQDPIHDLLRVVVKRRWVAVSTFLALAVPLSLFIWTQTPAYQSTTRVLVGSNDVPLKMIQDQSAQRESDTATLQTEAQVVGSRALAEKAIEPLKLSQRPQLVLQPTTALQRFKGWFRSVPTPPASTGAADLRFREALADGILAHLSVSPLPETRLLDISFEAADPAFAAQAANTIAAMYLQQDLDSRFAAVQQTSEWLSQRLAKQREQVEMSETALQQYREHQNASSLQERQNMVVQRLGDLNTAVTKAKTDRIAKEEVYRQLSGVQGDRDALESFPPILSNPFIQTLKAQLADLQRQERQTAEKLGDRHPEIVRLRGAVQAATARLDAEIDKAALSIRSDYEAARAQEQSLTAALEAQKREAQDLDRKAVDYSALDREAVGNRQLFDALLQEAKQSGLVADLRTSRLRIIDPARPAANPIRPHKGTELSVVLLGSLAGALALVLGMEQFDTRIKSPDQLADKLDLVVMGHVPLEHQAASLSPSSLSPTNAEAFRRIRTNMMLSGAQSSDRVVAITSAGVQEGKTTTASNLAAAIASAGQRVVLVDADMRRGRQHEIFDRPRDPGLAELLDGRVLLTEALRDGGVGQMKLLPAGAPPSNPAELLSSAAFGRLIQELRESFDWVIVDTPPVLAVADVSVIAQKADGVLFVVRADRTHIAAAQAALDELDKTQAILIGGILNGVDVDANPYYYSPYYRREYTQYYVSADTGRARSGRRAVG
jgi:succinoglycan biosynthesis transport protein ExoP